MREGEKLDQKSEKKLDQKSGERREYKNCRMREGRAEEKKEKKIKFSLFFAHQL